MTNITLSTGSGSCYLYTLSVFASLCVSESVCVCAVVSGTGSLVNTECIPAACCQGRGLACQPTVESVVRLQQDYDGRSHRLCMLLSIYSLTSAVFLSQDYQLYVELVVDTFLK